jgi:signal transduction histidine kinase
MEQARFEAILVEQARLARALHDTLLQRFTGITLQIDGVRASLQQQSNPLADDLSRILDQADQLLRESRENVWMANPNPGQ